jgi:tRNA-Thr(GGU) m(6)t(6)A37 methyltransferase TsaA
MFCADPIGFFYSAHHEKYSVPAQPISSIENEGVIVLKPHCQFQQALEGLEGFDRIWVIFWFHRNEHWKPKILPPRGEKKRGVFATRSPHRPNFIGLSCVQLKKIEGLKIWIAQHDLVDGTPILDIKPYLNEVDAKPALHQGWLEELEPRQCFEISWSECAQSQIDYLFRQWQLDLKESVETRLKINPLPYPNNRIKAKGSRYELAYKTWRILYEMQGDYIIILSIYSGYDAETLEGKKESRWPDVPIHIAFQKLFD